MAQPQVKFIKVQSYAKYVSAVKTHPSAIVFGEFADATAIASASASDVENNPINLPAECGFPVGTKLIYANGIQYDVTNLDKINGIDSSINYLDSSLATLYEIVNGLNTELGQDYLDLSTYVHITVDGSISDISTKVINITNNLTNVSSRLADVSARTNDLSTYVHTTVDGSISNISTRLSGALKNASLYAEAGTDSSVKITLVTRTVGDVSTNTEIKVNGSEYVNVQHANDAVSVVLQNITNSSNDINANSDKLVKADDLYNYVTTQINNLEGALQFRDGVDESSLDKLADPSTGDVYVALGEFELNDQHVENGDLLIYGENSWVIVERNLDGAVEASTALEADHVVVGGGNQTVKTTNFTLPTFDNSLGIADAEANQNVLTTEYAVRDYVDKEIAEKVAAVKVTANTGTPTYVDVSVDPTTGRDISVGVKTASLGDYADLTFENGEWKAADGTVQPDGLATAGDVARTIQDNELVVATALNTFKDKIGLANDLAINWEGKYDDGTSIVEAIKNINVAGDITTAIEGLNSSVVASAGTVLTKVVQEDGKLTAKEEATLTINGVQFNGTTALTAEIDADDIKLMTDGEANADGIGTEGNPTVKQAIFGLRDGKIGDVYTGNDEITVPVDSSLVELTSEFTQHTIDNEYNLSANTRKDVSILTELLVTKTNTTATALATDAYVQEQIANVLCWTEF